MAIVSGEIMFVAKVIEQGRITIPKKIRDLYDAEKGDHIIATIKEVVKE